MIIGVIVDLAVGAVCLVFGLLLWKKQKVSLLHDYHYKNVSEQDLPAYARLMGIGMLIIGTGICLSGVLLLLERIAATLAVLFAGLLAGTIVIGRAQKTYNGGWFG